jgi:hypothetical protein
MNPIQIASSAYAHVGSGPSLEFTGGAPNASVCWPVAAAFIWSLLTDALSYTAPDVVHLTLIVTVALPPARSVPTLQLSVEPASVQPDELDTKVAPAGSVSVTTTFVAASGPLSVTVMLYVAVLPDTA